MAVELKLGPVERRVLGVLIEKSLALPQYYPMTVNAITVGCNQKQNRDPVMELDEETVWDALESLRGHNLALRISAGPGGRADKWKHNAAEQLGWQTPQRAIMAELLLRGPQTVGELRGRAARMTTMESTEAVSEILNVLASANPPYVQQMPRQAGQSAVRWMHLMYPAGEEPSAPALAQGGGRETPPAASSRAGVEEQVQVLREEVAALRAEVEKLRADLRMLTG